MLIIDKNPFAIGEFSYPELEKRLGVIRITLTMKLIKVKMIAKIF